MGCSSSTQIIAPGGQPLKKKTDGKTAAWVAEPFKHMSLASPRRSTGAPSITTLGKYKAIMNSLDEIDMSAQEHIRDEMEYQNFLQLEVGRLAALLEKDHVSLSLARL